MGVDDILPWTDVQGTLKSWTVECDRADLSKLIKHPGIQSIKVLEVLAPRAKLKKAGTKTTNKYSGTKPLPQKTEAAGSPSEPQAVRQLWGRTM